MKQANAFIVLYVITLVFQGQHAYRNLVIPGVTIASQSSTYGVYDARRTVDGQPLKLSMGEGSCSHTGSRQTTAWLQIELDKVYNVKEVKFWYRKEPGKSGLYNTIRLHYYSMLYVDPVTNGYVTCHKDETNFTVPIPMPSTVSCKGETAFIVFYTTQPSPIDNGQVFLEICEVEIYGCSRNQYGENCTNCSDGCSKCDIDNGCVSCRERFTGINCQLCEPGYTGDNCDTYCARGWYGQNCSMECSKHCLNNATCNHVNGTCPWGCSPGYRGSMCTEECRAGTYGIWCRYRCSGNCFENQICNFVNGYCDGGCKSGWTGLGCRSPCRDGTYGENCANNCSGNCYQSQSCDRFDGTCVGGCNSGWTGQTCEQECPKGTYGFRCNQTCDNCLDNKCNAISGDCESGCNDGWVGNKCEQVCAKGYFGKNCQLDCGKCLTEGCHHVNGSCGGNCLDGWEGTQCLIAMALPPQDQTGSSIPMAGIGAGAGALIVIVVVVIVTVVLIRLRRKKLNTTSENNLMSVEQDQHARTKSDSKTSLRIPTETDELRMEPVYSNENGPTPDKHKVYSNDDIPPTRKINPDKDIQIGDFSYVFASKSKDEFQEIKKEYQSIPYGEQPQLSCSYGKLAKNVPKNRFKTTFPYDHSRVILKETADDYINANYIKNLQGEKAFIAAQGPRPNTVADHWKMIWQEHMTLIVMLTNLMEGTKKKCEKYWPDLQLEATFGKFKVLLLTENHYAFYIVRRMKVTFLETDSSRTVTQFHYTQWPDHGVPDPIDLVLFHQHVMRFRKKQKDGPTLVHCSAGIGRTGTFIALDVLHQSGQETGVVNVEEYVRMMRKDRMSMVQNVEQYIVLHQALLESFKGKHETIPLQSLKTIYQELQGDPKHPPDWLKTQFEELQSIKKHYSAKEQNAGYENRDLNMTRNILPVDRFRAVLTSPVASRTSYYNAVFLSTFLQKDALIAGQYPLSGNSIDLFRLLYDHECKVLIFINQLDDIPSTNEWFSDEKITLQPFEIMKKESCSISKSLKKHTLRIYHTEQDTSENIHVYEMTSWRLADTLPVDLDVFPDIMRHLQLDRNEWSEQTTITVLSKDGASGCGMICAVNNALQQLQQDGEVDMFTIVRQLQIRRPEMISTLEEFRSCFIVTYMALSASESNPEMYSNTECVYENM
uniref:protein-tyrosine-phosphatase n=1 Tax=Crassostrea virginica TaxID=6565 RepID=A0A8B8DBH1_CRAVI|nr:receptor-type tyrosine-protein phosphatase F-like isoform X2 [Crassostrea virginica]